VAIDVRAEGKVEVDPIATDSYLQILLQQTLADAFSCALMQSQVASTAKSLPWNW
jgi:hypothetical protein